MPVPPAERMAGRGDQHVAVFQIHHGGEIARIGKDVPFGRDGDRLVRKRAVIKERLLKVQDAFAVPLHAVQGSASQPRLPPERLIVLIRPALLLQKGGNVLARIGGEGARTRLYGGVRHQQGGGKQRQKGDDAKQDDKKNKGDAFCDPRGSHGFLLCAVCKQYIAFFAGCQLPQKKIA